MSNAAARRPWKTPRLSARCVRAVGGRQRCHQDFHTRLRGQYLPGYFREGTKFLFDGLALTGSGGTPYELLETQGLDYTEVLRGANAFQYGALSLGGAINMVTHSGLTAPGNHARLEAGSFGWRKQQLSTGGVVGNGDYYVSLSNSERDGYQDWTFTKAKGVVTNFGYRFNPKLETRLFVRYREEYHSSGT